MSHRKHSNTALGLVLLFKKKKKLNLKERLNNKAKPKRKIKKTKLNLKERLIRFSFVVKSFF